METKMRKHQNFAFTENEQKFNDNQFELFASRSFCSSSRKSNDSNSLNTEKHTPREEYSDVVPLLYEEKEDSLTIKSLRRNLSKNDFFKWLKVRTNTLKELETLVTDFHNEQLSYNKAQMVCRGISMYSRHIKMVPSPIGFIASAAAVLSDAARGVASTFQTFNTENYEIKFKDIMLHDARVTEDLYEPGFLQKNDHTVGARDDGKSAAISANDVIGLMSSYGAGNSKNGVMKVINMYLDELAISEDKKEIKRLQHKIGCCSSQTSLEAHMRDAIDVLKSEMEKNIDTYIQHCMSVSTYSILKNNLFLCLINFFIILKIASMFNFGNIWTTTLSLVLTIVSTDLLCRHFFVTESELAYQAVVVSIMMIFSVIVFITFSFWIAILVLFAVSKLYELTKDYE